MFQTTSFQRSGYLPDKSHYSYSCSTAFWRPPPEDMRIDQLLDEMASMDLGRQLQQPLPYTPIADSQGPMIEILDDDYDDRQYAGMLRDGRTQYAGSTSSVASSSRTARPGGGRAITYPAPSQVRYAPAPQSTYTRTSNNNRQTKQADEWAMIRHPTTQQQQQYYDDVGPSDSISQVSTSSRSRYAPHREERRGRTRTRGEHHRWAPSSVVSNKGYNSVAERPAPAPVPSGHFETRLITPYD